MPAPPLIGDFLQLTSLDELPQFINVLQGRVSVVVARPHAVAYNEHNRKSVGILQAKPCKNGYYGLGASK